MIGKLVGKAVAKKTTGIVARKAAPVADDIAEEAVDEPVKKSLVAPKTAFKATKSVEPTSTPAEAIDAPKTEAVLSTAEEYAQQMKLSSQTEEALPAPTATESPYNFPNKAFSDEEYAAAEQYLKENNSAAVFNAMKMDKEDFANQLQTTVSFQKGLKLKDSPPMPYAPKEYVPDETVAEELVDVSDIPPSRPAKKSIFSGKLGTAITKGSDNNEVLEEIRQLREQNYETLSSMPQSKKFDQPVLDIALAEFRHKYGYEFDPVVRRDTKRITSLMEEKQSQYNRLKKKYADTPDIALYHGGSGEKVASIESSGFRRPSLSKRTAQQELRIGSTSLTRDIGLNFNPASGFGGEADNVLETKMPYADYVFTRVNMTPSEYRNKDLDATLRTITGSPQGTRALQLPRSSGFFETESAYIESDKLKMGKNIEGMSQKKSVVDEFISKKRDLQDKLNDESAKLVGEYQRPMTSKDASRGYALVREYIQNAGKLGKVSNVKSGIGETYESAMSSLFYRQDYLIKLEEVLRKVGAAEKAANIERLIKISERGLNMGNDTKIGSDVLKLADKFNKGGLVRRK